MVIRVNDRNNVREVDLNSFGKDVVSFGRQPDCDIVLNTDTISRVHGAFYLDNGVWLIEDLKSTNGITLDGGKVKRATAKSGREFILYDSQEKGRVSFTVLGESAGQSETDTPVKKKGKAGLFIGIGVAAAVIVAAVLAVVFLKGNGMTKEEEAYYEYLSDIIEDADFASEVHVEVEDKDETTYYYGYAIEDFDTDKKLELFMINGYGASDDDYPDYVMCEFYEYESGEVKLSNSSFLEDGAVFPLTFYNNGIVKYELSDIENEYYRDDSSYMFSGSSKEYLKDIGLLPRDGISDDYDSYGDIVMILYNYDSEQYDIGMLDLEENDGDSKLVGELTEKEYKEIFGFAEEDNELDVKVKDFNIEEIADMCNKEPEEYEVYEYVIDVDGIKSGEDEDYSIEYGWWSVETLDEETATLWEYWGPNTEVTILETLGGYTITEIHDFDGSYVEKVIIPDTVTVIDDEAFVDCSYNLVEIEIPSSVEEIGEDAVGYYHDWYEDSDGYEVKKNENLTIIGEKGSAAEEYAEENGFDFKEKE